MAHTLKREQQTASPHAAAFRAIVYRLSFIVYAGEAC